MDILRHQFVVRVESQFYLNLLETQLVAHQNFPAVVGGYPAALIGIDTQVITPVHPGADFFPAAVAAHDHPIGWIISSRGAKNFFEGIKKAHLIL